MSYRIRFTYRDGSSGLLGSEYTNRTEAELEIARRSNPYNCITYTVEDATPDPRHPSPAKPPLGVMPRRVWEEQRIHALAKAIVRRTENGDASMGVFGLAHVNEWAAEIVDLCERGEGGR